MQVRSIQLTCGGSRLNVIREQTGLRYSVKRKAKVVFSLDEVDHERYRINFRNRVRLVSLSLPERFVYLYIFIYSPVRSSFPDFAPATSVAVSPVGELC